VFKIISSPEEGPGRRWAPHIRLFSGYQRLFPTGIQQAWHLADHSFLSRTAELCLLSTYNFMVCVCKILYLKANGLCCSMHGLHEHYIITGCKLERMTPRHRINEVLKCMSVLYVMDWKSITCSEWVCVCSLSNPGCKAHAPCYTAIRGLSGPTKLFHITSHTVRFLEKTYSI
jgi:hypothetical protein